MPSTVICLFMFGVVKRSIPATTMSTHFALVSCDVMQVVKLMEHQQFYIETKFDGDRMQLHKQGNQYRFFSRRSV